MPQVPATHAKLKIHRRILQKFWLTFCIVCPSVRKLAVTICIWQCCTDMHVWHTLCVQYYVSEYVQRCFDVSASPVEHHRHILPVIGNLANSFHIECLTIMTAKAMMVSMTLMMMLKTMILTLLYLSWFLTCCATNRTELIAFSRCGSWHSSHCQKPSQSFHPKTCQCCFMGIFLFQMTSEFCLQNHQNQWYINAMSSSQNVWHIECCLDWYFDSRLIVWSAKSCFDFCIHLFLYWVSKAAVVPGNVFSLLFGLTPTWDKSRMLFNLIEGDPPSMTHWQFDSCWYSCVSPEGSPVWLFLRKWEPVALEMIVNFWSVRRWM